MALSLLLGIDQNASEMFWAVRFHGGGHGGGISSGGPNADGSQSAHVFFAAPFASLPALRAPPVPKTFRAKTPGRKGARRRQCFVGVAPRQRASFLPG